MTLQKTSWQQVIFKFKGLSGEHMRFYQTGDHIEGGHEDYDSPHFGEMRVTVVFLATLDIIFEKKDNNTLSLCLNI